VRRIQVLVLLSLGLLLAIGVQVASAAGDASASGQRLPFKALDAQLSEAKPLTAEPIPFRFSSTKATLKKLIRRVNELTVGYNKLAEAHNQLVSSLETCIGKVPVTRYAGYWFGDPEIQTSALDVTIPGDQVSAVMATWNC
jgi:hypothetical protein